MKKICSIALIFVLTATLFAGCRGGGSTNPTTTVAPNASSSTRPTVMPKPEVPMPSGTNTTTPGNGAAHGGSADPEGTAGVPGRMARPSARGVRY